MLACSHKKSTPGQRGMETAKFGHDCAANLILQSDTTRPFSGDFGQCWNKSEVIKPNKDGAGTWVVISGEVHS